MVKSAPNNVVIFLSEKSWSLFFRKTAIIGTQIADDRLPLLFRRDARHRRGSLRAPRHHPDALPGGRHPPAEIRLPHLCQRRRAGAGTAAADRGRPADRADGGARAGDEIRDHAPLYRQAQMLARQGIVIDRSTLASWVGYAAAELKPLWRLLRDELLSSAKLFVDETTAPVLDPGRGRAKTGYFWAIARDDQPWGGSDPPAVVYTYAPGRGNEHVALLKDFRGILQTDAYVTYKKVAEPPGSEAGTGDGVILAHCWTHCRRRFFEIAARGPAPIAREALQRIAALYEIEAEIRGLSADERRAARQLRTKPLLDAIRLWLEQRQAELPRKSPLAEAIGYPLNQWEGLTRFVDDGRIEIDSNAVERSMRPIALNRKNALFAGHDVGAENWAVLASLIETCKLHGVNPEAWLADVLTSLVNGWPNRRLVELTPWAWKAAQNTVDRAAA